MELKTKYRATEISQLIGNDGTRDTIQRMMYADSLPQSIFLSGIPGSGKSMLAECIGIYRGCDISQALQFRVLDASETRAIADVRDIFEWAGKRPLSSKYKTLLVDEVHMLKADAQQVMLKLLEKPKKHLQLILATSEPSSVRSDVKSRCTPFIMHTLTPVVIARDLLAPIATAESIDLATENYTHKQMLMQIAKLSEGSCRNALVALNSAQYFDEQTTIDYMQTELESDKAANIVSLILGNGQLCKLLSTVAKSEYQPMQIRASILGVVHGMLSNCNDETKAKKLLAINDAFATSYVLNDNQMAELLRSIYVCKGI